MISTNAARRRRASAAARLSVRLPAGLLLAGLLLVLPGLPLAAQAAGPGAAQTAPAEGPATAEAGFSSFAEPSAEKAALSWHGLFSTSARAFFNWSDPAGSGLGLPTRFDLELKHAVKRGEFLARLHFSRDLSAGATAPEIDKFLRDMVDEAYTRLFFDGFDIEAGLLKLIWGKGDDMHVIDVLNPIDYSDFINNSYLERKTAELMLKTTLRFSDFAAIELVWQPVFNQDVIPQIGRWTPWQVSRLMSSLQPALTGIYTSLVTQYMAALAGNAALAQKFAAADIAAIQASALSSEDTSTLKYGTYAARFTGSFGPLDLGLAYAYTFLREPAIDPTRFSTSYKVYLTNDRVHMLGLEAGGAVSGFNLRSEAGLFLTGDLDGSDPRVRNPRLAWLAGFDRNLPVGSLNINIQARGQLVLFSDRISASPLLADTDWSGDSIYSDHVLALALSDAWANEKFKPKLAWTFNLEHQDWMLRPELNILPLDDVGIRLRWTWFYGSDKGSFGHYSAGSFAELSLSYQY